jgi:hypothetical protein
MTRPHDIAGGIGAQWALDAQRRRADRRGVGGALGDEGMRRSPACLPAQRRKSGAGDPASG